MIFFGKNSALIPYLAGQSLHCNLIFLWQSLHCSVNLLGKFPPQTHEAFIPCLALLWSYADFIPATLYSNVDYAQPNHGVDWTFVAGNI